MCLNFHGFSLLKSPENPNRIGITWYQAMNEFKKIFESLFDNAKSKDEFSFVFALLGINSGIEDQGWQPVEETLKLSHDFVSIINTPLVLHTRTRLALLLYCQITESSYMYHVIYNMLLTVEGSSPPLVFNFTDLIKNGTPPSVKSKVKCIISKAKKFNQYDLSKSLEDFFDSSIRNAVSHADYILYENEFRLKHRMDEVKKIPIQDLFFKIQRAIIFFETFFSVLEDYKKNSYKDGHIISGRKNKDGKPLSRINLKVDANAGLVGFSLPDPLPLW